MHLALLYKDRLGLGHSLEVVLCIFRVGLDGVGNHRRLFVSNLLYDWTEDDFLRWRRGMVPRRIQHG